MEAVLQGEGLRVIGEHRDCRPQGKEERLTLNQIARGYQGLVPNISRAGARVLRAIRACKTAALGGSVHRCTNCSYIDYRYSSCRNRHCPTCLSGQSKKWLEAQSEALLPVEYFHVVFTLPQEISELALGNKKALYGLLFSASAATLQTIARNPKRLGAEVGFTAVLHTWSQTLMHHPHLHCVVPGGGLSGDGQRWISCRPGFFLPVRVLGTYFRNRFIEGLERLARKGKLRFKGATAHLAKPEELAHLLERLRAKQWVVYSKPPFGSPAQVLKYLARYTHRVAISSSRLLAFDGGRVTFRYRKSSKTQEQGTMSLETGEFLRRFLLHVLPKGLHRIRHYGFLGNRRREAMVPFIRGLLEGKAVSPTLEPAGAGASASEEPSEAEAAGKIEGEVPKGVCPACRKGRLELVETIPRPSVSPHPRNTS